MLHTDIQIHNAPFSSPVNQAFSAAVNGNHSSRSSHSFLLDSSHAFVLAATHLSQNPSSLHGMSIKSCRPINGSFIRCTYNPVVCTSSAQRVFTRSALADAQPERWRSFPLLVFPLPLSGIICICVLRGQTKSVGALAAISAQARTSRSRAFNRSARGSSSRSISASLSSSASAREPSSTSIFATGDSTMACSNAGIRSSS
jgi:hypothetical protein